MKQNQIRQIRTVVEEGGVIVATLVCYDHDIKILSVDGNMAYMSDGKNYDLRYLEAGLLRME